ncbi:MAG: MCE family protein [Candidatus Omnitrophica bacterium]|nr:MCE family protein [Candidatus Omnitrophota bacterium]
MKKFTNELKTGLVIVLAIIVGVFFWLKTSNFKSEVYKLKTSFSHAEGIKENSIVTLAGIEVGRVENVNFVYEPNATKVELTLALDKSAKIREDSIAFIGTSGFIGDAYIGVASGNSGTYLKEGATIQSEDPIEARELMKKADKIAQNLDLILADVKNIVSDNKEKVDGIVLNIEQTAINFNEFSDDIKRHPWKLLMKGSDKKDKRK